MFEQSNAEKSDTADRDAFSDLTAYQVYESVLRSDYLKNHRAFSTLRSNLDTNNDGRLSYPELRLGMSRQNHQGSDDANLNRLLCGNYGLIEGLSRSRYAPSSVRGITESDVDDIYLMGSEQWREVTALQHRISDRDEVTRIGAHVGFGVGLGCSAVAIGLMRFAPAKFRAPLLLTAVAALPLATLAGELVYDVRNGFTAKWDSQDKMNRARWLNTDCSDGAALSAYNVYNQVCEERIDKLDSPSNFSADVNGNGFVDRAELSLALKSNTGNQQFNRFLDSNYAEMELLSRDVRNNLERGVSSRAVMLVGHSLERQRHFQSERSLGQEITHSVLKESLLKNSVQWGAVGGILALRATLLPAPIRLRCYAGAAAVGAIGAIAATIYDTRHAANETDKLLLQQESAVEKVHRGLKYQY